VTLDIIDAGKVETRHKDPVPDKKKADLPVEFANIMDDGVKRIGKVSVTPGFSRSGPQSSCR